MRDKLYRAFDSIKAEEQLKEKTAAFICRQAKPVKKPVPLRRLAVAAACLLALIFAGGRTYTAYFTPVAFLDVDINPGVELTLNRFDRVIAVHAYNDDGQAAVTDLPLTHKPYDRAMDLLLDAFAEAGYLTERGLLSVTVQSGGDGEALLSAVTARTDATLEAHHPSLAREVYLVDGDTKSSAQTLDISPAKYLAIVALQEVDPTATFESCRHHSIGELRTYTEQHGGGHHDTGGGTESPDGGSGEAEQSHHGDSSHDGSGGAEAAPAARTAGGETGHGADGEHPAESRTERHETGHSGSHR